MFNRIYLEITNQCNRSCAFCPKTKRKSGFLTLEEFDFLTTRVQNYTKTLCFHVMGEPLAHPLLGEFLQMAEEKGFQVMITTNGTLLKQQEEALLSSKSLFKINISLHSFEANSQKNQQEYFENCFDFAEKSSKKGVVTVLRLWNLDGDLEGIHSENDRIIEMMKNRLPGIWARDNRGYCIDKKLFLQFDGRFKWPNVEEKPLYETRKCRALRDQIAVLCDGSVVPCCLDGEGAVILGNLFSEELSEILSKERTKNLKNALTNGTFLEENLCKTCGFANRFQKSE